MIKNLKRRSSVTHSGAFVGADITPLDLPLGVHYNFPVPVEILLVCAECSAPLFLLLSLRRFSERRGVR